MSIIRSFLVIAGTTIAFLFATANAQENSQFEIAVQHWLDGNDEVSLPMLSKLAHGGDEQAQIFLARIEGSSSSYSTYVDGLDRKQRISTFRKPGGLSGRSWLKVLSKKSALARAFSDAKFATTRAPAIYNLFRLGEKRAGYQALLLELRGGDLSNVVKHIPAGDIHPELLPIVKIYAIATSMRKTLKIDSKIVRNRSTFTNELQIISAGFTLFPLNADENLKLKLALHPYSSIFNLTDAEYSLFDDMLMQLKFTDVLKVPCSNMCPNEIRSCVRTAYLGVGGSFGTVNLGSPANTLVNHTRYIFSKRSELDLLTKIKQSMVRKSLFSYDLLKVSPCLYKKISNTR